MKLVARKASAMEIDRPARALLGSRAREARSAGTAREFQATVRHLFRHISEAEELRKNSLVQGAFRQSAGPRDDREVIAKLHSQILRYAQECETEDIGLGLKQQAIRHRRIVEGICFGEAPIDVAKQLGLSLRQYYRERQASCARIAKRLLSVGTRSVEVSEASDALDFLFRRARVLIEVGCSGQAATLLSKEAGVIGKGAQREAIWLHLSRTFVLHGDVQRAIEAFHIARAIRETLDPKDDYPGLAALRLLADVDLGIASGLSTQVAALFRLIPSVVAQDEATTVTVQELKMELLLEQADHTLRFGNYEGSVGAFEKLSSLLRSQNNVSPYLNVLVAAHAALRSEYRADVRERSLALWDRVLLTSQSLSSARGHYYALTGLVRYFLFVGSDEEAYRFFRRLCGVGRAMESSRPRISAGVLGATLLKSRFWQDIGPILDESRKLAQPGSWPAATIDAARGQFLAQSEKLIEALPVLEAAMECARTLGILPLLAKTMREYSLVLYRLRDKVKAREYVQEAVLLSESVADALSLRDTYRVATGILMDNLELRR